MQMKICLHIPVKGLREAVLAALPVRSASKSLMILTRPVEDVLAPP